MIQRARANTQALTRADIAQLHRSIGNAAVGRLITSIGSPQPATGLPGPLKRNVEARSGLSMDDVRVHRDSPEPERVDALAFARGTEIHLGPGQEQHLPHEAWHVVQQKQGRVSPTAQVNGAAINDDVHLEREAEGFDPHARSGRAPSTNPVHLRRDVIQTFPNPLKWVRAKIQQLLDYLRYYRHDPTVHIEAMRIRRDQTNDSALRDIIDEALESYDSGRINLAYGKSEWGSHYIAPKNLNDRTDVVIDNKNEIYDSLAKLDSIVLHEITHSTVDQSYPINRETAASIGSSSTGPSTPLLAPSASEAGPRPNETFNVVGMDEDTFASQISSLRDIATEIHTEIENEAAVLGAATSTYILKRLEKAEVQTLQEFDTIMNELFYYLSSLGSAVLSTESYRLIRAAARAAMSARKEGKDVKTGYDEFKS